jgi:GNAT superfamily N-acetyltransferase
MDRFAEDLGLLRSVYNRAWEANWGFVPMTEAEFAFSAEEMRRIVEPDFVLVAEMGGEAVGCALALPDYNLVLRRLGGSLWPFGWLKALWYGPRIRWIRVLALGVVPGARDRGIEAGLILELVRACSRKGFEGGECSWTLRRNRAIHRTMEATGARPYRTYRLYSGPV